MKGKKIQLRDYHLKHGRNNNGTLIYPVTKAEYVEGLSDYIPEASPAIIVVDETFDWSTSPKNPTLVYDSADGSYAIWRTDGLLDYIDMQAERVVKVGVDDLGSEHSYDLNPGVYYIFLNNIKDSLKLLQLGFSDDTHTAEIKGRFTAVLDEEDAFTLTLPLNVHIPEKYLDNNSLALEEDHTYEFSLLGNIFMITDITSTTLSDDPDSSDPIVNPGGGKLTGK